MSRALPALALLLWTVATGAAGDESTDSGFRLVEVTSDAGLDFVSVSGDGSMDYIIEANGNGAALLDYDGDGDLDLLQVSGTTLSEYDERGGRPLVALYRNEGDLRFKNVTESAGFSDIGWGMGTCVADVDRDGDPDVYVTAYGPNRLFRNNGDGTFDEIAAPAGVADPRWSHSCAFGDFDLDGDPDIYVANYVVFDRTQIPPRGEDAPCTYQGFRTFCGPLGLTAEADGIYRNHGDGSFEQISADGTARFALGVVFADLDDDGQPEFFVTNDSQHNVLLRPGPKGVMRDLALLSGVAVNEMGIPQASMGIAVGDYDNDLDLDLFVTNFSEDYNTLYRNHGQGFFVDYSLASGVAQSSLTELGWATLFADLDNDGWLDLFIANGHVYENAKEMGLGSTFLQPNRLFLNTRDGRFRDASALIDDRATGAQSSRGLTIGDLDLDGDLDLVVVNTNSTPTLLRNDLDTASHWLRVKLMTGRDRPDPAGTRITVTVDGTARIGELVGGGSYLSSSEPVVHFGLGSAKRLDRLEIRLPGGRRRALLFPPSGYTYIFD